MKKFIAAVILLGACTLANAQQLVSKKGTPVLPEPKDWSIGLQADPFLKYIGNFFNKDNNNNTTLSPQIPLTLVGLYVKDEHTAYRMKLRVGLGTRTLNNFVDDNDYSGPPPSAKTTDTWKHTYWQLVVGAGL